MEKKAEWLLSEERSRPGWGQVDLELLAKGQAAKIEIARRLRAQTIVTWSWIAESGRSLWAPAADLVPNPKRGGLYYWTFTR